MVEILEITTASASLVITGLRVRHMRVAAKHKPEPAPLEADPQTEEEWEIRRARDLWIANKITMDDFELCVNYAIKRPGAAKALPRKLREQIRPPKRKLKRPAMGGAPFHPVFPGTSHSSASMSRALSYASGAMSYASGAVMGHYKPEQIEPECLDKAGQYGWVDCRCDSCVQRRRDYWNLGDPIFDAIAKPEMVAKLEMERPIALGMGTRKEWR